MNSNTPGAAKSFSVAWAGAATQRDTEASPNPDWPHAPVHRLTDNGIYFLTAATLHKARLFDTDEKRDRLERMLLSMAKAANWQLEAWAVLSNHYHLVARGNADSVPFGEFVSALHSKSAIDLNRVEGVQGSKIWYNFWDTKLTHQYSYLARLNYVHQNAVKHGLVQVDNQYKWCSAPWFERTASPAQRKTIYSFKIDTVNVEDDF